ncbi:hypothetical protein GCM10023321_28000 [Pseudonocardia eucalypti]|uniref:Uncharacterized protein n=1 Tax=Pseudonocardia eucalypti TaxID=648755 RepID=A0ABP9Q783_9PSEU
MALILPRIVPSRQLAKPNLTWPFGSVACLLVGIPEIPTLRTQIPDSPYPKSRLAVPGSPTRRGGRRPGVVGLAAEDGAELVEDAGVVDGGRDGLVGAVGDAAHRFAQDFA